MSNRFVLDTNVINWLVEGSITPADLPSSGQLVIAPLQISELQACSDETRREALMHWVELLALVEVPGESFCFGVPGAGFGQAKFSSGRVSEQLLTELNARRRHKGNKVDALIGEIAMKNGWTLVTADRRLGDAVYRVGGHALVITRPMNSSPTSPKAD